MQKSARNQLLLPRVIYGNRGDILSRWGLINGLEKTGNSLAEVFAHEADDLPKQFRDTYVSYGKFHNLVLSQKAHSVLSKADKIIWGGGLDITDESSKSKLIYLNVLFSYYRILGKEIYCVFQGIGPINTYVGRLLAKQVLKKVHCFVARDQYSYDLVKQLNPKIEILLAGDAIFFPGFEEQLIDREPESVFSRYINDHRKPVIGINIRRWFHFSSDLVPFQLAKKKYEKRGQEQMRSLVENYVEIIKRLRKKYNARIILISAYKPGVFSWEDDLPWLQKIKSFFLDDEEVMLLNEEIDMLDYLHIMNRLDFVFSMRLHTSLTTIRFGNPAINLSYSPKGVHIFKSLGMEANVFDINDFLQNPAMIWERIEYVLENLESEREKNQICVKKMIDRNMDALRYVTRRS